MQESDFEIIPVSSLVKRHKLLKDRTGLKFGKVTALGLSPKAKDLWVCRCECGRLCTKYATNLAAKGKPRSCGCAERIARKRTHGKTGTKVYNIWGAMIQRCTNPNNKTFCYYGGRGITVCERWMKFANFYEDMGEPADKMTLDRVNNEKGYSKENCRWATMHEQCLNRRSKWRNRHTTP